MSRFWSELVHSLQPYVPGEQPKLANLVKLNTNENPYGPSPKVLTAIQDYVDDRLRLYPDPTASRMRQAIADYYQVQSEQVFVGNGSDEVLAHTFNGLLKHSKAIAFPDISYSFYPVYCDLYTIEYETIAVTDQFEIDIEDYQHKDYSAIIFPNPNAPTGRELALEKIEQLLLAKPDTLLVVDEAYIDFGGQSAIPLVKCYDNLLVIQTLSKSRSLANLRIGYAIGHTDLIQALVRIKDSFNSYPVDGLAMEAAIASFADESYFQQCRLKVMEQRDWLTEQLVQLGFVVIPSKANFIFVSHPQHDAAKLMQGLRHQGVIVRHFSSARIDQYLRITIGTESQNTRLVSVFQSLL